MRENTMPKVTYNDPKVSKLYGSFTKTLRLKIKGESVKFVLGAEYPVMYGLHWIDRKPFACPRVNQESDCPRCKEGFDLLADLKKQKLDEKSKEYKDLKQKAMGYLPDIKYYYPIFATGGSFGRGAYILEATKMSYDRFGDLQSKGKDILNLHWQLDRTNKPGSYYTLDDIVEAYELTAEELEDIAKVAETDIDASMNYPSILDYYSQSVSDEVAEVEGMDNIDDIDDLLKKDKKNANRVEESGL
jgi:hypothetical protein